MRSDTKIRTQVSYMFTYAGHFLPEEDDKFFESVRAAVEQEENQAQSVINMETEENVIPSEEGTTQTTGNEIINKDTDKESNDVAAASCEKTVEAPPPDKGVDNVSNLPVECYHYYYGSNLDMGRLIEVGFLQLYISFIFLLQRFSS